MDHYNVNIRRRFIPDNITDGVFTGVWVSNGVNDHIMVDIVKLMSISPVIEKIVREFDLPLFCLDGLMILVPETEAETLEVLHDLMNNCKTPMINKHVYRCLEKLFMSLGFSSTIQPMMIESGDKEKFNKIEKYEEEEDKTPDTDFFDETVNHVVDIKEESDKDDANSSDDSDHNYYSKSENPDINRNSVKQDKEELSPSREYDDEWLPRNTPKTKKTGKMKMKRSSSSGSVKGGSDSKMKRFRKCGACENCVWNLEIEK